MKFGEIPSSEAAGAILAHSVKSGAVAFKKGRVLSKADISALLDEGVKQIFAARLEEGDLTENDAARTVALAAAGAGVKIAEPFTGRANLFAEEAGLFLADEERLRQINHLDESLTIATLPAFTPVKPRQMLATVKVIPFAAPEKIVDSACHICATPLISVSPFKVHGAGLVMTQLSSTKESLLKKTEHVIADRLEACGSTLAETAVGGHTIVEISDAISKLHEKGCSPILVFGASAIVDRGDVVPAGLADAGGQVVHLGMPVDPGNLLMYGKLKDVAVIGVPSCARSPKLNGFDWVLQRVLAGVPVKAENIMDMGAGGLLKEIPSRPRPRESAAELVASAPQIAAVVLAAGRSTRMGEDNKLLKKVGGEPMVRRVVETALNSQAEKIIVVTGHQADEVKAALEGLAVEFVSNPDFADGLSTSLKQGMKELDDETDGALVLLSDMPLVTSRLLNQLIAAFDPVEGRSICVPVFDGKRGNPVLWGRQYFTQFAGLTGDIGAKHLMSENEDGVCEVATTSEAVLADFDTPESLAGLK
ncbi:MAG: NTP transferase domain-containing protein [Hyphomicrobiales bacterium]